MFDTAFEKLGLRESDRSRIVMIGNNLKKDIGTTAIRNRYEAYGFLADRYQPITQATKDLKKDMDNYLEDLSANDHAAMMKSAALVITLEDLIVSVAKMAAEAMRIHEDLSKLEGIYHAD